MSSGRLSLSLLCACLGLLPAVGPAAAAADTPAAPTRARTWLARVVVATDALRAPANGPRVAHVGVRARWAGGPVELLVLGTRFGPDGARWLRVRLPRRPNGSAGWIRADKVALSSTPWRIEISLRRRRVVVLRAGRVWRTFSAVVGAPGTRTPTGTFAVSERVRQRNPRGFYGRWILFLTAFSDDVRWFDGNAGQVGIHGRGGASLRDPLGAARSHGCVRMSNRAVSALAKRAREGTPVVIT